PGVLGLRLVELLLPAWTPLTSVATRTCSPVVATQLSGTGSGPEPRVRRGVPGLRSVGSSPRLRPASCSAPRCSHLSVAAITQSGSHPPPMGQPGQLITQLAASAIRQSRPLPAPYATHTPTSSWWLRTAPFASRTPLTIAG